MSKPLKVAGIVLGAVALAATGIGAVIGAGAFLGMTATTLATVGTVAGIGSTVAGMGSQMLAKPPPARGSVSQISLDPNSPQPYGVGEGYLGGVLRHQAGYGGTVDKVVNPYLFEAWVFSGAGPVESISPRVDFATPPAWYSGYLYTDTQLGACPEADALAAHWGSPPGWGSAYKLSGQAAIGWNFLFDKNGKKFASGMPVTGAYGKWVKVYDPRKDSTRPGGSGSHRINNEATFEWSENPALHAGTYAYGRYQNGKLVMGIGMPADAIDWDVVAAWANTCDTNGWTIFGRVFEPGDKWQNLIDICAAGGGQPIPMGVLSFRYPAATVALATITEADLADPDDSVCGMQSYRDRINEVIPKYTDPNSNWQQVQAEAVRVDDYVTEDGEVKTAEWPFNMVKDVDQAAQLAAYKLVDARELFPIQLTAKPQWRGYRPGDCLHLDLPQMGLDHDVIILNRQFDPASMTVKLTMISETAGKHAFALGETGVAPDTPALAMTSQERDETAANATNSQITIEVPAAKVFQADYTGAITAGLPAYVTPSVAKGGQDIRTADNVSYSIATSGMTATVDNTPGSPTKGRITITAVDSISSTLDLTVTVDGIAYPPKRMSVQRTDGLPSGFGGAGSKIASDNGFPGISSNTDVAITDVLTVTVAGSEILYGTAPLGYEIEPIGTVGSRTLYAKWQYSPVGAGTWTDFGSEISGASASNENADGETFASSGAYTQSASPGTGDWDVRMVGRLNASGRTVYVYGTATIEAKV